MKWQSTTAVFIIACLIVSPVCLWALEPLPPLPTKQQLEWQNMELIFFTHFGINTFNNAEWGKGNEDPKRFNPTEFDAKQWAKTIRDAGGKLLILTCKHHDGFCLWPSKYTEHSVKNSAWKGGQGDVVREVSDACREYGLKFGVYLSPWDRNNPGYGDSPVYNKYFVNQLTELLTNYGPIAEVWFDGANGEGPNGKKQVYDWTSYYETVRRLQPEAIIAIMGPDVRWVGNESGVAAETEWNVQVVKEGGLDDPRTKFNSTLVKSSPRYIIDGAETLNDQAFTHLAKNASELSDSANLIWYPSETDVSIRPGWFYHADQDSKVKSLKHMIDIYCSSIGRGSVLLLNLPPDQRGLIHENDVKRLHELRAYLDETFKTDLARQAVLSSDVTSSEFSLINLIDQDAATIWAGEKGKESAAFEAQWKKPVQFDMVMLQEPMYLGQRVAEFSLDAWVDGAWKTIGKGTTIGAKRLVRFPMVETTRLRVNIAKSRAQPVLHTFGVYKQAMHTE